MLPPPGFPPQSVVFLLNSQVVPASAYLPQSSAPAPPKKGKGKGKVTGKVVFEPIPTTVSGGKHWEESKRDKLIKWFLNDSDRLKDYKLNPREESEKISWKVFKSARSSNAVFSNAVDAQCDYMKEKYIECRTSPKSTGNGEFDLAKLKENSEKWNSICDSWLAARCP